MPDPTKKGRRKPNSPKAFIIRSGLKPKMGIWCLALFFHPLVQEPLRKVARNEDGAYGWHHEEQIWDIANSGKDVPITPAPKGAIPSNRRRPST